MICIAGGGPAGMMLGYLLARAGRPVLVLEKHADFFRDFRGDTIHPSTLEVMYELGLLEEFLAVEHDEVRELAGQVGGQRVKIADFRHLPTHCKMIALMPQWDFLNFLAERARRYAHFRLVMQAEVTDIIVDKNRVTGVRARTPLGEQEFRADLVVGADGRSSTVRERAGLIVRDIGAPMDVLWFRIGRDATDPEQVFGYIDAGKILVLIGRRGYWQCGYVIRKGGYEDVVRGGVDAFRDQLVALAPFLRERAASELRSFDDVHVLTVKIDRLERWYRDGLLCIGDAAHAMSPIGGVGINLAIQDAVAAANILTAHDPAATATLAQVQRRRELPARVTQGIQVFIQHNIVERVLGGGRIRLPLLLRVLDRMPLLQRLPAYAVGIGVRPEHVRSPSVSA